MAVRPIFILGMPRTGTSLVEQILSSHSQVTQGGELDEFRFAVYRTLPGGLKQGSIEQDLANLTPEQLDQIADDYLSHLATHFPGAGIITDKQPINFMYLGFIALCLPKAKILHCQRDPLDTCLSCYFNDFTGFHYYSTDLKELGRYYNAYQSLMSHWRKHCGDRFLDVQYEELVTRFEPMARQLLEYCELPWEDAVLHYYEGKTAVKTGSIEQVRRAPYQDSIGRWRQYESQLQPLIEILKNSNGSVED